MKLRSLTVRLLLQLLPPLSAGAAFVLWFVDDAEHKEEYERKNSVRSVNVQAAPERAAGEAAAPSEQGGGVRKQAAVHYTLPARAGETLRQASPSPAPMDRVAAVPAFAVYEGAAPAAPQISCPVAGAPLHAAGARPGRAARDTAAVLFAGDGDGGSYGALAQTAPASAEPPVLRGNMVMTGSGSVSTTQEYDLNLGSSYKIAAGVNPTDITSSDRFYDNAKGKFWVIQADQPYQGAYALYASTGSLDFLGHLKDYVPEGTTKVDYTTFDNLKVDDGSCWYQACSNMLQYWQSYYGVFCKDPRGTVYGYNYDKAYIEQLVSTQALSISMHFFDNWGNDGGYVSDGLSWFLAGYSLGAYTRPKDNGTNAGFYSAYFPKASSSGAAQLELGATGDCRATIKAWLDETFAVEGQLASVDIVASGGHAVTCYGYTMDADGNLQSLLVADSDDSQYGLYQYFIGSDGLSIYMDADLTKRYGSWELVRLHRLETPKVLQDMLAAYRVNDMTWNGAMTVWDNDPVPATLDALPTSATGWDVFSVDDYYHSYFDAERSVTFNDHGSADGKSPVTVTVKGAHSTPRLTLANTKANYFFNGESGAAISTQSMVVSGSARSLFTNITVNAQSLAVNRGTLAIGSSATLQAETASVTSPGVLELAGGAAEIGSLAIESGGTLSVTAASTFTGNAVLKDGAKFLFSLTNANTSSALLQWNGSLSLDGLVSFRFNDGLTNGTDYRLISFTDGSGMSGDFQSHLAALDGTLSYTDNTLWLHYVAPTTLVWNSAGDLVWSSSLWEGQAATPNTCNLSFVDSGVADAGVSVSGAVSSAKINVSSGSYVWKDGGSASIGGESALTVSGSAALTSKVVMDGVSVALKDNAQMTFAAGAASTLESLNMGSGTTAVVNQALEVRSVGDISGTVTVGSTGDLHFRAQEDTVIAGVINSGAATSVLRFSNRSDTEAIVYEAGSAVSAFAGNISVGQGGDAFGTTLRMQGSAANSIALAENAVLELSGAGQNLTSAVTGSGTIHFAAGSSYTVKSSYAILGNNGVIGELRINPNVSLDIDGTVELGEYVYYQPYAISTLNKNIRIGEKGSLTVSLSKSASYAVANDISIDSLELDGGKLYRKVIATYVVTPFDIGKLTVTSNGGTITDQNPAYVGSNLKNATVNIAEIEGAGNLTIDSSSERAAYCYYIAKTGDAGYTGDITLQTSYTWTSGDYLNSAVLELGTVNMSGKVTLKNEGSARSQIGMGLRGDAVIAGLNAAAPEKGSIFLYVGAVQDSLASFKTTSNFPADAYTAEAHTLTLNGNGDYSFAGTVFGTGLSLVKSGTGTQTFSGTVSGLNGNISVEMGTLSFDTNNLDSVQNLYLTSQATLAAEGVRVNGTFQTRDNMVHLIEATESGSVTPVSIVQANLDLTAASSIDLGTVVDMTGHNLALASGTSLLGYLDESRRSGDYLYYDLFSNIGTLTINGDEAAYETTISGLTLAAGQELWYDQGTLSVRMSPNLLTYRKLGTEGVDAYAAESTGVLVADATAAVDLSGHTGLALGAAAGTSVRMEGDITLATGADYRFGGPGTLTVASTLSGEHGMVVEAHGYTGGRIELASAASLSGAVVVQAGAQGGDIRLVLSQSDSLDSASSVTVKAGGTLEVAGTQAMPLALDGGLLDMQNDATVSGNTRLASASTVNVATGTGTLGGLAAEAGAALTKTGAGTLSLNGTNEITGRIEVQGGTLKIAEDASLEHESVGIAATGSEGARLQGVTLEGATLAAASETQKGRIDGTLIQLHNGVKLTLKDTVISADSNIVSSTTALATFAGTENAAEEVVSQGSVLEVTTPGATLSATSVTIGSETVEGSLVYGIECTAFSDLLLSGDLTVDFGTLLQKALDASARYLALHLVNTSVGESGLTASAILGAGTYLPGTVTTVTASGYAVPSVTYGTAQDTAQDIVVYWAIPEPATGTLGVLAFAALAARRRRNGRI